MASNTAIMTMPASSPILEGDPEKILNFAHKAAKALTTVINSKPKQVMINNERYLSFEDWQTIARFYGATVGIEWTKSMPKNEQTFGYEARAVTYKNGIIISAAEASCSRDEFNWSEKPAFQIKSMAQTRAMAKCLRNVFAWVVVLAGFKPTPAEEMTDVKEATENQEGYNVSDNYRNFENSASITEKQANLLRSLIIEKIVNEEERESRLNTLGELSKAEASAAINRLINNEI